MNYSLFFAFLILLPLSASFSLLPTGRSPAATSRRPRKSNNNIARANTRCLASTQSQDSSSSSSGVEDPLGLTPELRKITDAFNNIGDDKLRYKQLLYMATNSLPPMDAALKTDENKVPGCLSTVHVYATVNEKRLIAYQGDSDGLLTKGLVALLVRGLSGYTAEEIQKVNPEFIQEAQISASLTPGRNNGFLNMLATMKRQAAAAAAAETTEEEEETEATTTTESGDNNGASASGGGPVYNTIMATLQLLKPTVLELEDVSDGKESHFDVFVVAEAFEGLDPAKREQLIYTLLGSVVPRIEALEIKAVTVEEHENSQ